MFTNGENELGKKDGGTMIFLKECKENLKLLKRNLWPIVKFEAVYKLVTTMVLIPLFIALFRWTITASGIGYLSADTAMQYLSSPVSIVLDIAMLFVLALVTLLDIFAVIDALHAAHFDQTVTMRQMLHTGFDQAKHVFNKNNWFLVVYTVLIIPLVGIVAASGVISSIKIPGFILDYIYRSPVLNILSILFLIAVFVLVMKWALSFHAFMFDSGDFKAARTESTRLMKGHFVHTVIEIIFWEAILYLIVFALSFAIDALAMLVIKLAVPSDGAYAAGLQASYIIGMAISALYAAFSVPLVFAHISGLYYDAKEHAGLPVPAYEPRPIKPSRKPVRVAISVVVGACLILNGINFVAIQSDNYVYRQDITRRARVTAHRGDSLSAPENSLPAFQKAIDEGADWIELDVRQTKDGVVVVTHDANLQRIAGVDKNVSDLTYDELQTYDVGSWFSNDYKGLKVATLDEALKLCKGKVKVNIELKDADDKPDFIQNVIRVVDQNGFKNDCVLASAGLDALREVKSFDPSCRTLYIMTIAAGDVFSEPAADAFSLEAYSVTEDIVGEIHQAGKQLFVWTVNDEESVDEMVGLRVDNIITDDLAATREAIENDKTSQSAQWITGLFFEKTDDSSR